jgi:hypothetical protein
MTRQVAIAALIAFAVTVLALSVSSPSPDASPAPAQPAPEVQQLARPQLHFRREDRIGGLVVRPDLAVRLHVAGAPATDAGTP